MSDERSPPSIEGYRIVGRLGHGSMGTVWRAVDRSGRAVALKLPDRARRVSEPQRDEMFRREALVALNLRHPNLVRGLDVGETRDGTPFLAMELVEGETLGQRFRAHGPIAERELVEVGRAVAAALEHAHALGLLHRDVKPDNVMLLPDGQVKLVDWSIAVERGHEELGCGSPGYASPEMIRKQDVGPASDLYALGVTLAVAALGRPYFEGRDVQAVLRASLRVPLELPRTVAGAPLSEGFRAVVARLGRKEPGERYGSAGEVRLDFEALAHGERPLGAYLGLARLGRALRPSRWLWGLAGVAAAIWLAVLATSGSSDGSVRRAPRAAAYVGGPVPEATDPRVEVVLLYLDAHPTDYRKGREMLAERLAASPPASIRARLETASRRLEERFAAAAAARLLERAATARELAADGDLDGVDRALFDWPAELAEAPQQAEARRLASELRAEALEPGRRLLVEGEAALARWQDAEDDALDEARDLLARLDESLEHAPREPVQRPRLVALRSQVGSRVVALARARRERDARAALAAALARADADDAAGSRTALEVLAGAPDGPSEVAKRLADVLARGREVEGRLAARTAALGAVPWAGIVDGRWHVGRRAQPPAARDVFAPVPTKGAGAVDGADIPDLRAAEPDPELCASWLLLVGLPDAAAVVAPAGGDVSRVLAAADRPKPRPTSSHGGAWADLARWLPLLLRVPGAAVPEPPPTTDVVTAAWYGAIRPSSRGAVPGTRKPAAPSPALLAARTAFLADDLLTAWVHLERAADAAPTDPEVAILRSRVLDALSKPLRTVGIALRALAEARRAWDLDPALPASARLVAEECLRFRSHHPGVHADALAPIAIAACEEAARVGRADAPMLVFLGERRLQDGRAKDAVTWLRRAVREAPEDGDVTLSLARAEEGVGDGKRALQALERARELLGPKFPSWASEMLERLAKR